jgi:hypothetical protein
MPGMVLRARGIMMTKNDSWHEGSGSFIGRDGNVSESLLKTCPKSIVYWWWN